MKNKSNFYLGLFLVLLGILFLLDNYHVIDISFSKIINLWPLMLILWGLRYIPMNHLWRQVANIFVILLFFALLIFGPEWKVSRYFHHKYHYGWNQDERHDNAHTNNISLTSPMKPEIKRAKLNMVLPALDLQLDKPVKDLYSLIADDYPMDLYPTVNITDSTASVNIRTRDEQTFHNDDFSGEAILNLNGTIPWELSFHSGAADMDLDLSPYIIRKLDIHSGASDINIRAGNRSELTEIFIKAGASDITINVPADTDLSLKFKNVLGSEDLDGLVKDGEGSYRNPGYGKAKKKVIINIQSAVSSLKITRD